MNSPITSLEVASAHEFAVKYKCTNWLNSTYAVIYSLEYE